MLDLWMSTAISAFLSALLANEILMRRARLQLTPLMRAALPRFERQWAGARRRLVMPVALVAAIMLLPSLLRFSGWLPSLSHSLETLAVGSGSVLILVLAFRSTRAQQKAAAFPDAYLAVSRRSFAIVVLGVSTLFLMAAAKFQWPQL